MKMLVTLMILLTATYPRQHQRCQLHDVLFMSPQDGEEEAGTVYYIVRTGDCPSGYIHNRLLNFCYQLHTDQKMYNNGRADCVSRGDHLAVIDSEEKLNHVAKQVPSSSVTNVCSYFIDGSDAAEGGKWVFHDGRDVTYKPWAPGFPLNGTTRKYIVARRQQNFQWRDTEANNAKCYICEWDVWHASRRLCVSPITEQDTVTHLKMISCDWICHVTSEHTILYYP